jgi:hypothetical protein
MSPRSQRESVAAELFALSSGSSRHNRHFTRMTPPSGGDRLDVFGHAGGDGQLGRWTVTRTYEVVVRGSVSEQLILDLGARSFEPRKGMTVILLDVVDQSHLHGVLASLQDRNIDVERVNPV